MPPNSMLAAIAGQPPAAPKPPAQPPELRPFGDALAIRKKLYDNVLNKVKSLGPVSNNRYSLEITEPHYADPEEIPLAEHKRAILENRTLGRRLRGTLTLKDAAGNTVDQRKLTLARVPHLSRHGTFVYGGVDWTLAHQMRMRPGSYTRRKHNGELENMINVMPGKGFSHRIYMDPETGVFRMQVGQSKQPLLPVLRAFGATNNQLAEAWGSELLAANQRHESDAAINKLYAKLVRRGDPPAGDKRALVAQRLGEMELDPVVTKQTLGTPHAKLGLPAYLDVTKKLLRVHRGEEDPDDRDHPAYQVLYGPEDLLPERIGRGPGSLHSLLWKASLHGNLKHVPVNFLEAPMQAAILSSGLGNPIEEVSPLEILDQQFKVSRMGAGGIPDPDAIPEEARAVNTGQLGALDFIKTPESSQAGVDLRAASQVRKGPGGEFYIPVRSLQTGQTEYHTPAEIQQATLAFTGELARNEPYIHAIDRGKLRMVPRANAQFELPAMENGLSPLMNMIPLKSNANPHRDGMGGRMLAQALSLDEPESPLVQSAMPDNPNRSFEEEYGKHAGALFAPAAGTVLEATPDAIKVQYADGHTENHELLNNQPLNRKSPWTQTPLVAAGQQVQPGQILARSNFTDANGAIGVGKNLRVAYLSPHGLAYEDAIVISKSASDKLRSQHLYQHNAEWTDDIRKGRDAFISLFPAAYKRSQLAAFDEHGVIKPGTVVQSGDPLILQAKPAQVSQNRLHRRHGPSWTNQTVLWEHHTPGIVTDVAHTSKGALVVVKASMPMQIGDKLSQRFGGKGVISAILDDHDMARDSQGRPFEIMISPLGTISRGNPSQIIEANLGKIAERTGQPYKVPSFSDQEDMSAWAEQELAKHGLSSLEDIYDGVTGRKIPQVQTGNMFFMKLSHTAESKGGGRGFGGYSSEGEPGHQSKKVGILELNSLLSHGAVENIRDIHLHRGQAHPDYWAQFMSGHAPPPPEVPQVWHKFVNQLKAAGINVVREGSRMHLMALRDKDIDELAQGRELTSAETVNWKAGLKPIPGGLFDEVLTSGHGGKLWSSFPLAEPMLSPIFEDPARRLLGITKERFQNIIAGKDQLNGQTGMDAIHKALASINLDQEINRCREAIAGTKKTARDDAIRRLKYLKDAQRLGIHPREWMWSKVPVLPPAFRPVMTMGSKGLPLVADANLLYQELFDANKNLSEMRHLVDDTGAERSAVYAALKAVVGLGDPIRPANQEKHVTGFIKSLLGSNPKAGIVQRKLLSARTDLVGRSTVIPNPEFDMDTVGLPENTAWDVYTPFIVRNLVRRGMKRVDAMRSLKARDPQARDALNQELEARPVIINRAPVLHRYGFMAFRPRLVKGDAVQVSPVVVQPYTMDFDGDAVQWHVPSTDDAAREALDLMLPSKNLFSVRSLAETPTYGLNQEYVTGNYMSSTKVDHVTPVRTFATTKDALAAYHAGTTGVGQRVRILQPG